MYFIFNFLFFFFKQKTAYEIYQCDWSSDVCSSDLDVSTAISKQLQPIIEKLPAGYRIEQAGSIEESGKATKAMLPLFPIMLAVTLLILIFQVRSIPAMVMVFLTSPLGLIGVVPTLIRFGQPFGINALVGLIALAFPEVLGVGYEATSSALSNRMELWLLLALILAKTLATAITIGSRMGGGVFSPSLYLGAMTGGAFGIIAAQIFPDLASSPAVYATIGMGAVAAAVLGAPVSTAVMIFELTGSFSISISVLLAVSISTGLSQEARPQLRRP